jgi:LuxR family maltose regulon positive regulatory protein
MQGEHWLDMAERVLQSQAETDDARNLRGEVAAARGFAASFRGDATEVVDLAEEALRDVDRDNLLTRGLAHLALGRAYMADGELVRAAQSYAEAASIMRHSGNAYAVVRAMFGQSQMEHAQGQLHRAMETCRQGIAWSAEHEHPYPGVGILYAARADVLREWNDLDAALRLADESVRWCRQVEYELDLDTHVFSLFALARVEQARGQLDTALELVHQTQGLVKPTKSHLPMAILRAYAAQLWLLQDNLPAALDCAGKAAADQSLKQFRFDLDFFVFGHQLVPIIPIQMLMAQGQSGGGTAALHQALTLLQQESERASESGLLWVQIKLRVLQALAHHVLGDRERARVPLEQALILGQPEGYVRIFADEGAPMATLLHEFAPDDTLRDYVATLLLAIHPTQ